MKRYFTNLKLQAEQNPLMALAIAIAVLNALASVIGKSVQARNSATWAKEVERRRMNAIM